jgi:hypothetical protein
MMWNWLSCYLSGRHDYGITCEPGAVFLKCGHCGRRSTGWAVDGPAGQTVKVEHLPRALPFAAAQTVARQKSA